MLHRRALIREMGLTTAAVLTVLVAIALVILFIRLLGDVARGELANEAVFAYLGFSLLYFLPVLMALALFAGVLMSFARMWRDSEMAIWFSTGLSLTHWLRPVMGFAIPFTLVVLLLTVVINPWVQGKRGEYRDELKSRGDSSLVVPGMFAETGGGERVYFVESLNPLTGVIRNVFMQSRIDGVLGLVVAQEGSYTRLEDGSRYLVFKDGRRVEGTPGSLDYRIVEFERYWMRLDAVALGSRDINLRQLRLDELLADGSARADAEVLWRFTMPLSVLILVALAIPLGFVNARANRSYGFLIALLLYFTYYNFMSLSQAWVVQSRLDFWTALILPHAVMLAVVILLFHLRARLKPLFGRNA